MMTAWLHKIFWLVHRLFPKGEVGAVMPLWPGGLAVVFLCGAVGLSFFAWRHIEMIQTERGRIAGLAALFLLIFGLLDWVLMAALPRLGLSFGGLSRGLIGITSIRLVVSLLVAMTLWSAIILQRWTSFSIQPNLLSYGLAALLLFNALLLAIEVQGLYLEPFDLQTTQIRLAGPDKGKGSALRILQISDTHVERITRRERDLLQLVRELDPDLILLTGDYTNLDYLDDPRALKDTRSVLAGLSAPFGVFAVTGSVDTPKVLEQVFSGLPIHLLQDEVYLLQIDDQTLALIGISDINQERDSQVLADLMQQVPEQAFSLLLYHTPDLIETADREEIDLYLAGHTHGGQVRLPFFGAIVTMSAYGKQYEMGLYQLNPTTLYVSRGVGMEGMGLPRVRFLCPPEIVLIELGAGSQQ